MTRDRIYPGPKQYRLPSLHEPTTTPTLPYPTNHYPTTAPILPTTTKPPHLFPPYPHFILYHTLPPTLPYTYSLHVNNHHKRHSPYTPLLPPHNPLPTPSCPTILSTCPTILHPFSPTHSYHYHYSLPYLILTSFPTLLYHLPLSHTPVPFLPSPHLLIYRAYPLPYSYISLVCHTLQLKTEYHPMMSEFIANHMPASHQLVYF